MRRKWILIASLAILAMLLFTFIGGEIVLHRWNWLMLQLFGFRQINFWQALGLLLLCRILFGGLGRHSYYGRSRFRRRMEERYGAPDARRARTLRIWPSPQREQGAMKPSQVFHVSQRRTFWG